MIEKRRQQYEEYMKWQAELKERFDEEKELRLELRNGEWSFYTSNACVFKFV